MQSKRYELEAKARQTRFNSGLKGLWGRLNGQRRKLQEQSEREALLGERRDRDEQDSVVFRKLAERQKLYVRIKKIRHTREHSLKLDIQQYRDIQDKKRDVFEFKKRMQSGRSIRVKT